MYETDATSSADAPPRPRESRDRSPRLLVSVRSAAESLVALRGGASFIDIKEPARGSLGRAPLEVQTEVVAAVDAARALAAGRSADVAVTAALGELVESELPGAFRPLPGISLYKLGLSGCRGRRTWPDELEAWRERLATTGAELAAVAYADHAAARAPGPARVLEHAVASGLPFLLVDTFVKRTGSLTELLSERVLRELIDEAHRHGVAIALAGSLRLEDVSGLTKLGADVLAVRGAACVDGRRDLDLDVARIEALARTLQS